MPTLNADLAWHLSGPLLAVFYFTALSLSGRQRGLQFLHDWARTQGFVLVSARRRLFVPHWRWRPSKGYQFFRVTVRDGDGVLRANWTRCSDFSPIFPRTDPTTMDVIWDDPAPQIASA